MLNVDRPEQKFKTPLPTVQRVYPNTDNIVHTDLNAIIEEELVSPQIVSGSILIVELNYKINIIRVSAVLPGTEITSVSIKTINTPEGTVHSLARISINIPNEHSTPYLFHVVENFMENYGVIVCLSTSEPSEDLFAEE